MDSHLGNECEATVKLRRAAEAKDVPAVVATLAPDVVLYSPITDQVVFRGAEEVGALLRSLFATIDDVHYIADVGTDRTRALFYRTRVGGQPLEEAMRLELDERGRIRELTIFYRPLPGLTALAAGLGPRVSLAKHGRLRSLVARVMLAPLASITRRGDRLTRWLA